MRSTDSWKQIKTRPNEPSPSMYFFSSTYRYLKSFSLPFWSGTLLWIMIAFGCRLISSYRSSSDIYMEDSANIVINYRRWAKISAEWVRSKIKQKLDNSTGWFAVVLGIPAHWMGNHGFPILLSEMHDFGYCRFLMFLNRFCSCTMLSGCLRRFRCSRCGCCGRRW